MPPPPAGGQGPERVAARPSDRRPLRVRLAGPPGTYDRGLVRAASPPAPPQAPPPTMPWQRRGAAVPGVSLHPRAVPTEWLRAWLSERRRPARRDGVPCPRPTPKPAPAAAAILPLLLPTDAEGPLCSPGLGGAAAACGPLRLWHVPCLVMALGDGREWLRPHAPTAAHLRLAPEWQVWWSLAAIASEAVGQRHVAPTLAPVADTDTVLPVWRPLLNQAERARLYRWAERLPAAALDFWTADPVEASLRLVCELVDAGVRTRLQTPLARRIWQERARAWSQGGVWLRTLATPSPRPCPVQDVGRQAIAWLADPLGTAGEPRIVLRLDEPAAEAEDEPADAGTDASPGAGEAGRWPLRIFLRPADDPGGLVPAARVWQAGDGAGILRISGGPHGATWLAARLQALRRILPELGRAAATGEDTLLLDAEAAWRFLSVTTARLQAAGVEVLVPSFWTTPPRVRLRLESVEAEGSGLFRAEALVRFSWEVAVGGRTLTTAEFEELVARRTPLCRLGSGWMALAPEQARAIAERWRHGGASGEVGIGQALLLAMRTEAESAGSTPADAPAAVDADAALLPLLRRLSDAATELPEPHGFVGTLRPYQRQGFAWMATRAALGLGGILADDMGLGKTVQVLALLAHRHTRGVRAPSLVVCPTSVVANWEAEAQRFAPGLRVHTHHGADRARGASLEEACRQADVVLTSYNLLVRDADALVAIPWDGLVLDEAQAVKNAETKQAQVARRLRARYRLALTGTPVENTLGDLWSIFACVVPGYLGSAQAFRRNIAGPVEHQRDEAAARTLRRLVAPLILRRTKEEPGIIDELPARIETTERCHLTPEQAALYEAVARELLRRIAEAPSAMARRAAVLTALLRLKQVCNHPAHYSGDALPLSGRSGKLTRLEELLAEVVAEGQRALVFMQYAAFGRRLAEHLRHVLAPCPVLRMDGATPAAERSELVRRFQRGSGPSLEVSDTHGAPPEGPCVFLLTVKTGGAGLNLTAARHVFHYDRWWNPAVERQATDRAHRIGQRQAVQVHRFICVGTLEERIDALLQRKQDLFDSVLSTAGEAWLTELGDDELREILSLRRAALMEA
jgi:superfamily II DNA or RNA helicase